jgi:predicted MPP superfamily phosphohydrolase
MGCWAITIRFAWSPVSRKWEFAYCSTNANRSPGDGESIYLAGIDDAHYYQVDNIEKAASSIPPDAFSILLSHTPEVYRHAATPGSTYS